MGTSRQLGTALPEVTLLHDARGPRPEDAAGVGEFWYETEIWTLPISPQGKVLYAGLCSHLKHGEINREDLRATLKGSSDEAVVGALQDLASHGLLKPLNVGLPGYEVRSVRASAG